MTAFLWFKIGCLTALVAWEFVKGVREGMRRGG